ncbi:choice-of-anchor D domain-containing protein [Ilumatobacter sp.]|uniref:choice-of-anchor D domain-containing protein n=1 Tax=Ilumatobacter sp. TaxID=1967498 RepID=UPI003B529360
MTTPTRERRTQRLIGRVACVAAALSAGVGAGDVGAGPGAAVRQADGGDDGAEVFDPDILPVGDVNGIRASISGDGRFVVFEGAPAGADGADADGETVAGADQGAPSAGRQTTIYLTDRAEATTIELTPVPADLRPGDSVRPVISGDGCSVAIVTQMALDVFRDDDTGERWDVYRSTTPHCDGSPGDWELISTRLDSGLARDDVAVASPTLSRSGTLIAYTHPADHLAGADGITTISLVDVTSPIDDVGRSRIVAGSPADAPSDTYVHTGLDQPALSGDGRFLAYRSDATSSEAVPGWAPGTTDGGPAIAQVHVWEIDQLDPFVAVSLLSVAPDGSPSATGAGEPDLSRDGTVVAFTSSSPLVEGARFPVCATSCPTQVYVVDRDGGDDGELDAPGTVSVELVSRENGSDPAIAGLAASRAPSVSGDGQLVAFTTTAPNLQLIEVPGVGRGPDGDLLLAELRLGRLRRLSDDAYGVIPTQGVHARPDLDDSGRTVVFDTAAGADLLFGGALPGRQVVARTSDPLLSLADADLGTTLVGVEGDEWYVAVVNDGPSSFRPSAVTMSNSRFSIDEEKSSCLISSAIAAGGSCTVAVSFTPSRPGRTTGTLTVTEEGFGAVSVSSQVAGAGGEPALRINPAGADLGLVTVGEASQEFQFDLSNVGFAATEIRSYAISGEHAGDFRFTSNNCQQRPVNPQATCSIGLTFRPSDEGRRTALVEIGTGDDQYTTMVVAGDGEFAPVVEIDAVEVDAGGEFVATGARYPPNTEVVIVFGDGPGSSVSVTTDADGSFTASIPVDPNERGGERRIVVQTTSGAAATAPVEVVEDDRVPVGIPGFGLG